MPRYLSPAGLPLHSAQATVFLLLAGSAAPGAISAQVVPPATGQDACAALGKSALGAVLGENVSLVARLEPATTGTVPLPPHCRVDGAINERRSAMDGRTYAVRFVLRLPIADQWNGRFLQLGGGGWNGTAPTALKPLFGNGPTPLSRGFAVIDTDAGHNGTNADPAAGGGAAFGRDPQARRDHFYNAYDLVARAGQWLTRTFYGRLGKSYFVGCSEGGREAMLMSQRFPSYFDGIAAGAPQFLQPMQSLGSVRGLQLLGTAARGQGLLDTDGNPAIHKLFSNADLALAARAINDACDGADGLRDGLISRAGSCQASAVHRALQRRVCSPASHGPCLTAVQVETLEQLHAPTLNARGQELYPGYPWDSGIVAETAGFRSWWLGRHDADRSDSTKLFFSVPMLRMIWSSPATPFAFADSPRLAYSYDWRAADVDPAKAFAAADVRDSAGVQMINNSAQLDAFRARGGRLLMWTGAADATHSLYQTTRYMDRLRARYGAGTDRFARLFISPGVAHCGGGPGPGTFDLIGPLVAWVETGSAPVAIPAKTADGAAERPLCSYPAYARYTGGPGSRASSFRCTVPRAR